MPTEKQHKIRDFVIVSLKDFYSQLPFKLGDGSDSIVLNKSGEATGDLSTVSGEGTVASNDAEFSTGKYNQSNQNTIFSVGIGTSDSVRKNALEILQNGNVYLYNLGNYNGSNYSSATTLQDVINSKQAALVSGTNIKTINNISLLGSGNIDFSNVYHPYGGGNISFSASTFSASGNTTIGGTLIVGTASVNKATTLNGTLSATGNTTIGGTLNVGTSSAKRATTLNGTLTITDTTTAQNIVSGGTASTTGRYDIGTSSNYWRYIYANRYYLADGIYFVVDQHGVKLEGAGFYTDSFVSAGGFSDTGGASGVDLEAVWDSVGGHGDSYSSVQVDAAHLTNYYTKSQITTLINTAISSVLKFKGVTTTELSDGSTTNPITIEGSSYTAIQGDVVMYNHKEFLWTGSAWEEMGDESSWALKTISITGTGYLTGGGDLTTNRTISIDSTKLSDSQSANALGTSSNLVTERDVYYGLPTINNSHSYTSSTTIYAPTSAGTANQVLISAGGTSAPTWTNQSNLIGSGVLKIAANSSTAVVTLYNANISSDTVAIKFVNGNYITASVTAAVSSSPAEVSFSHNTSGATSGSYGDSNNQTPSYGGTFKVPYVTVDTYGHITGISEHTVKIPVSDNTDEKVKQLAVITTSKAYPILLGYSEVTTEVTNHVNKASTLTYNPSTKALVTGGTVDGYTLNVASGYNVANNLTTSSSGSYVLDAYQGKLLNEKFESYLPLAGGTMSGAIKRYYSAASNDPTLSVVSNSKDIWLWRIYTGTAVGTTTSGVNGFGLKYIGTGSTVNKNLILYADNQTGTAVKAVTINQAGQIGIGTDPNTSYRAYIDGASYINGMLTITSGVKLTTTKKIWFGDTYYLELDANGLHTNAGFYSDSFVSAGGLSSAGGSGGIDADAMWELLAENTSDKINISHLPISTSGSGNYISGVNITSGTPGSIVFTYGTLPTSLKNPNALTFGTQSYDGSVQKEITAVDLSACVIGTIVGSVTIIT